jgi:hypothetical protein
LLEQVLKDDHKGALLWSLMSNHSSGNAKCSSTHVTFDHGDERSDIHLYGGFGLPGAASAIAAIQVCIGAKHSSMLVMLNLTLFLLNCLHSFQGCVQSRSALSGGCHCIRATSGHGLFNKALKSRGRFRASAGSTIPAKVRQKIDLATSSYTYKGQFRH